MRPILLRPTTSENNADQKIIELVLYTEQIAALLTETISQLKSVLRGTATQNVDTILENADARYRQIIDSRRTLPEV